MTKDRLFYSLTESSLFDTYLLYGIIGLLLFIALMGLIILVITSCCCFYSIPCCLCCHPHQRHLTYKLNEKFQEENRKNFIKRHSSDVTNFSQLYNSNPHLSMITTGITNKNFDASSTTLNSHITPVSPCSSFRSFIESVPLVQKNPPRILHRLPPSNHSIISIDNTNIYDTVLPLTATTTPGRSTPIYETEWTHNYKQLMMNKIPSIERNAVSVIELPSVTQPDLVPSMNYFQQQHPYHQILANRIKTSDSMRRAHMLKQIKDDAAFLY